MRRVLFAITQWLFIIFYTRVDVRFRCWNCASNPHESNLCTECSISYFRAIQSIWEIFRLRQEIKLMTKYGFPYHQLINKVLIRNGICGGVHSYGHHFVQFLLQGSNSIIISLSPHLFPAISNSISYLPG